MVTGTTNKPKPDQERDERIPIGPQDVITWN